MKKKIFIPVEESAKKSFDKHGIEWRETDFRTTIIQKGTELYHCSDSGPIKAFAPVVSCFRRDIKFDSLTGEIYKLVVPEDVEAVENENEVRICLKPGWELEHIGECIVTAWPDETVFPAFLRQTKKAIRFLDGTVFEYTVGRL